MNQDGQSHIVRTEAKVSVAWASDVGRRNENQDRAVVQAHRDGSWLIGVTDGLSAHPHGAEAAAVAIEALPDRIAGAAALWAAFGAANAQVAALAPPHHFEAHPQSRIIRAPASTLGVAAWTPECGLVVGVSGDTLPVLVWREDNAWQGRSLCSPHRSDGDHGYLTKHLGRSDKWRDEPLGTDFDPIEMLAGADLELPDTAITMAIVIVSDGVWEPIISGVFTDQLRPPDAIAAAVAACLTPEDSDADGITERIMTTARTAGLEDNATVAVACRTGSARLQRMSSQVLDDAEQKLEQLPRTFFSTEKAAEQLWVGVDDARRVLTELERQRRALRVCREGWVLTWRYRPHEERNAPVLVAYLDDMMRHLGVKYYLSYAGAAQMRGASHHGVMRKRVQVEIGDDAAMNALELRHASGPRDLAIAFHRIDPQHGRPVAIIQRILSRPGGEERAMSERCIVRVATMETALLDMIERPDRCGGMDHIATIAVKALFRKRLHPKALADASDLYAPGVARRIGSMLQQLRGVQHRINLRPLHRRVRTRGIGTPIEIHIGEPDITRRADRWGVTHSERLDPDY